MLVANPISPDFLEISRLQSGARQAMVANMDHAGFSVEQISVALGLSLEDTRELLTRVQ
jgi:hypothetical protein